MPPCLANHPNTSRRELLVGRRELLQVSVEKGETQVREFLQESKKNTGVVFFLRE
jgi:hypothetical protein